MAKTPMLLRTATLDCKFELDDGIERDLFAALKSAHIETGTHTVVSGASFDIVVDEYDYADITEIDLMVTITMQLGATDPVYFERRKITVLKSGATWSVFRDIRTTNRDLFKSIQITVDEVSSSASGHLTFAVTGLNASATETKFKYFSQTKF